MRILIVHSLYRSGPSGENSVVADQVNALISSGHDVELVSKQTPENSEALNYLVSSGIRVATGFGENPLSLIKEKSPDVVHVHNLFPNWSTRWLNTLPFPLVATLHNFRTICAAGNLYRNGNACDLCPTKGSHNALRFGCYQGSRIRTIPLAINTAKPQHNPLLNRPQRLIFLSEENRKRFQRYIGRTILDRSEVIPNFSPSLTAHEVGFTDKQRYGWIFAGHIQESKGILELINKWPLAERLDVYGSGPDFQVSRLLAAGKNIRFHGHVDRSELLKALGQSEGLIFPSLAYEQSPMIVLEAFSVGTPVIATASSGIGQEIEKLNVGTSLRDFQSLSAALTAVRQSQKEMSTRAIRQHSSAFSADKWVSSIESAYSAAISEYQAQITSENS